MKFFHGALVLLAGFMAALSGPAEAWTDDAAPRRTIAILAFPGVELLDFAGPAEVFAVAAGSTGAYDIKVVGATRDPIVSQGIVTITPTHAIADVPAPDILIIPGGGVGSILRDQGLMSWIRESAGEADVVASVCNGALVLARLGLLDGLEATTHYGSIAGLRESTTDTVVHEDQRFVDNGRILTAAGISAGIDMALYLVAREDGEAVARSIARYMEYPFPDISDVPGVRAGRVATAVPNSAASVTADDAGADAAGADDVLLDHSFALAGLDPVALVCGERIAGDSERTVDADGYRYRFASERNHEAFVADTGRYRIEHGGTCAGMRGTAGPGTGDPAVFTVFGGRIYLFASSRCKADFDGDPASFDLERSRLRQAP